MDDNMGQLEDDAPTTIKEVGVHISYLRRDVGNLTRMVQELPNGFATKEELRALENEVITIKNKNNSFWVRFGIPTFSAFAGAILVILVLSFLNRLR